MPKDDTDKQARLAEALRSNLRRRKAQSRNQAARELDATVSEAAPARTPTRPPIE